MSTREIKEIVDWLIDGARSAPQPAQVLAQLSERLVACGIPLWRVAVFVRRRHSCGDLHNAAGWRLHRRADSGYRGDHHAAGEGCRNPSTAADGKHLARYLCRA